ncbi:MAG: 4-(cytidine 5'-diphospho)-2-C-methyl-D-erythritol kinase [Chloroflexi bacterium]|nr:4-(cytidine 5'-diphospho)-2-C-methyl-D-erythritol kinase [Chloroflexota bacterium]
MNINSHAKINLTLEVIDKYEDGYHNIKSIIQTIDMYDILEFRPSNSVNINMNGYAVPINTNIIYKTVKYLKNLYSIQEGINIKVEKNIPLAAGFGGGSSNAANTLLVLNKIWDLNLSLKEMVDVAINIGSDVPYFLYQGTALVQCKGEKITKLPDAHINNILVITPNGQIIPNKTKTMFSYLIKDNYSDGKLTDNLIEKINNNLSIRNNDIYNVFGEISFLAYDFMQLLVCRLSKYGISKINICGAGPSVFIIGCDTELIKKINEDEHLNMFNKFLVKPYKSDT